MKTLFKTFVAVALAGLSFHKAASQINADPLTGRASTGIPIWTITSGDLSAPIALSYSSGAKVNDGEGSAGMGWSLMAGGEVRREVRGLPDDFVGAVSGVTGDLRNGWLHGDIAKQVQNFNPTGSLDCGSADIADFNTLTNIIGAGYQNDTEPDVFYFNAPGLSGQFIFHKDKKPRTIPFQDVKIQITRILGDSLISQIDITNNLGIKYSFTAGDKVVRSASSNGFVAPTRLIKNYGYYYTDATSSRPATFYSSWHLSSITSPNGGIISFGYGFAFDSQGSVPVRYINSSLHVDTLYSVMDRVIGAGRVSTITGANHRAALAWNGDLIASVSISELTYQSVVKTFNFRYHNVKATAPSGNKAKRSYLTDVSVVVNCNAFPGYQFTYYGVNLSADTTPMPFDSSIGQDLFGYYDSTATSGVPEIYKKDSGVGIDGEKYRIAPATGYSLIATGGGRSVNTAKVFYGALKTLTLPSGGVCTVNYEATDYYDALTSSNLTGGGYRVKKIITTGAGVGSNMTIAYRYRSSTSPSRSSGQWIYRPMFMATAVGLTDAMVPDNLAPDESIYYSRVEESVTGRGKTVYEFKNSGMYGTTSTGDFNASFTRIVRPDPGGGSCLALSDATTGYYTFPHAPNTNYDFERGLPLRVSEYTRGGSLVRRKTNTYQRTHPAMESIYAIRFERSDSSIQFQKYTTLASVGNTIATESVRVYDGSDSTTATYIETLSTYTYNSNQMLSQVASGNSDGTTNYQTFKYAKDYAATGTDTLSTMINYLVANNQHATLVETVTLNGSTVTGASLTLFNNNFGNSRVLPSKQLTLGDPSGFTNSTVSGSAFNYASTKYYTTAVIDAYDAFGNPTIMRDQSKMTASVIMGYNNSMPALDIQNARYDQVAYSDFEPASSTAVTYTGTISSSDPWSGQKCLSLTNSTNAQQATVVRAPGKNYRFSCWAKAVSSVTLSIVIKVGSTAISTTTQPVPAGNWIYLEKIIDMSGVTVNTNFTFQLTSSGNVSIDNLAYYPESSTISAHVYDPLNGKTADLDSRGNAAFQDFDALGRLRFVKNVDKDIVLIKDYNYKNASSPLPSNQITGNLAPSTGVSTTFGAGASCMDELGFTWSVDGVGVGTLSTMSYTFNENRDYYVRLVTSSPYGSSTAEVTVHPIPVLSLTLSNDGSNSFTCNDPTGTRTITASLTGCYDGYDGTTYYTTYTWYNKIGTGSLQLIGTTTSNSIVYTLQPGNANSVYCVVRSSCYNKTTGHHDEYPNSITTTPRGFSYTGGPC